MLARSIEWAVKKECDILGNQRQFFVFFACARPGENLQRGRQQPIKVMRMDGDLYLGPFMEGVLENFLGFGAVSERGRLSVRALVPREGIIRNHRHDEPLFVLSIVA